MGISPKPQSFPFIDVITEAANISERIDEAMGTYPPPLIQMITEAISCLKEKSGSCQRAIAKFIEEKYYVFGLPKNFKRKLSTQLNELAKSGKLVKVKRSFKLPVTEKSEKNFVEIKEKKVTEKSKKSSVEIKEKKKEKKIKEVVMVIKNNIEAEKRLEFLKYEEKIKRLSEVRMPRIWKKKELIQKEKANLAEWKKVAGMSSVDLTLVGSLEELMQVQQELVEVQEQTVAQIQCLEDKYEKKLWEWECLQKQNDPVQMGLFKQRSEIIKSIPKFWSTAFMSDYSLQRRLNEVDKKIINYLDSVVVEGSLDAASECTITLNFKENPFFKNSSLTKEFKLSHEGIIEAKGTTITWKTGKGITAGLEEKGSEQSNSDMNKSFFTWFCEDPKKKLHDKVANLIARDLWRYAPEYFVNAKENGKQS